MHNCLQFVWERGVKNCSRFLVAGGGCFGLRGRPNPKTLENAHNQHHEGRSLFSRRQSFATCVDFST